VRFPSDKWGFVTCWVATARRLDLQGIGSLVRQQLGAEGSGEAVGKFEYPNVVQQSQHDVSLGA
jgi:hypothetical protein